MILPVLPGGGGLSAEVRVDVPAHHGLLVPGA